MTYFGFRKLLFIYKGNMKVFNTYIENLKKNIIIAKIV